MDGLPHNVVQVCRFAWQAAALVDGSIVLGSAWQHVLGSAVQHFAIPSLLWAWTAVRKTTKTHPTGVRTCIAKLKDIPCKAGEGAWAYLSVELSGTHVVGQSPLETGLLLGQDVPSYGWPLDTPSRVESGGLISTKSSARLRVNTENR